MSKFDHLRGVPRLAQPARRPGLGEARGRRRGPRRGPRARDDAACPRSCARRSSTTCRCIRTAARRSLPALRAAQEQHGWLSPEAIDQVGGRDAGHARPTSSRSRRFYDMLEPQPVGPPHDLRVHEHLVPAARRRRGARRAVEATGAPVGGSSPDGSSTCARSSASARATSRRWPRSRATTAGPLTPEDAAHDRRSTCARAAAPSDVLPEKRLREAAPAERPSAMSDGILFKHVDVPDLNRIDDLRAPRRLPRAAPGADRDDARPGAEGARGVAACAAAAAPASRWARRRASCRTGDIDKYLCCNADESEPGTFKDRELMHRQPAPADRGHADRRLRGRRQPRLHLHPRRVRGAGRHPRRRGRPRPTRAATSASASSAPDFTLQPRRAPRRRRLHLRRGDRAARLARGQARQPAPEAAVPGQPGPLPGPDADQQRRDALQRPAHHRERAPTGSRKFGTERSPGTKVVSVSGYVQRPGNYEIELGIPAREIIYDLAGGPPEGRRVKAWFPGGSSAPGPDRGAPRPALRLRAHGRGRLDARLGRDHRGRRLRPDRRRRAAAGRVLPPRVVRQVHAVPRGHELDREDARAHRPRRGDTDGPRRDGRRPGATSSATACACWATRWRCRSAR